MTCHSRLLLFTRFPEAGFTKTRLIPELGAEAAARLQKVLTERIVAQARALSRQHNIAIEVHFSGGSREKMVSWLGPLAFQSQVEGDLGRRMQAAFDHAFSAGVQRAVLIGSDIPDVDTALLADAFAALHSAQVVIGPSRDGGYYLIGMRAAVSTLVYPLLFEQIPWSTSEVMRLTCKRLESAACDPALLPTLRDIDSPEDLNFAREKGLL